MPRSAGSDRPCRPPCRENRDGNAEHSALGSLHPRPNGLAHRHVGSLHAADATLALQAARDIYTRRGEGLSTGSFRRTQSPRPIRPRRT